MASSPSPPRALLAAAISICRFRKLSSSFIRESASSSADHAGGARYNLRCTSNELRSLMRSAMAEVDAAAAGSAQVARLALPLLWRTLLSRDAWRMCGAREKGSCSSLVLLAVAGEGVRGVPCAQTASRVFTASTIALLLVGNGTELDAVLLDAYKRA
ncbi:hypothetical protein CVT25_005577 [Psilocybe cyanescens]|uniref:Uncharacterized protein n=1 Tax=Psilocybe cyanescens TaxID=93625 RepID=A0A409X622_PSICY|nr:hypothetical protein CVT25_005577 [Psilocybe cyanescens]